jgi:hypothetical protein
MKKCVHVPVQTWGRSDPNDQFGGWFSALGGLKTLLRALVLILETCLTSLCLVPLVLQSNKTVAETIIERKLAAHEMMLWKYRPLDQDLTLFDPGWVRASKGGVM